MAEKALIDAIKHYQKDIERCPDNKERMLRCIKRLYVMPIKLEHLQVTGVGRSVNNLREVNGEVGDAATALVAKWKAMVTAEAVDHQSEDDSPVEEEELVEDPPEKSNGRISPDNELSVGDKENIRHNQRIDKIKIDKYEKYEKTKHSEKPEKDYKSKHSPKDKETPSKKENLSKNHSSSSSSKDKKEKDRSSEKHRDSRKSDHKSTSEKEKKRKEETNKHHSKSRDDKHSSKSRESGKDKDHKHSSSSSKDKNKEKSNSSREKESSRKEKPREKSKDRERSKERIEKIVKKEKRSKSLEKESIKCEKRKHSDKNNYDESPPKKIKKIKIEKLSSDEECEDELESRSESENNYNSYNTCSDNEMDSHSDNEEMEQDSKSGSEDDHSDSETYGKIRIKQEPLSDSESEGENSKRKSTSSHSKHKDRRSDSMRPPSSTKSDTNLKALIKENEKKIKKEKGLDTSASEKSKKTKVKIEVNQDGSIDSGSGASFADALLGFDKPSTSSSKKKKKKEKDVDKPAETSSRMSSASSTSRSLGRRSRSPSQCSVTSHVSASSSKSSVSKMLPLMTSSPTKPLTLEDIDSTLPEISTNYKPLPSIVQSRHSQNQQQSLTEEEMFSHMTSKSQRTKVYSGYKYGHTASVPSLFSFCIQVLYDNIDGLEYTGGVPYEILKPLLTKLNAEQLLNLEHYNPYLVSDTDDLWKFHCRKTFPKALPDEMESWRETYLRFLDERELKLKRLTANITESMAKSGPARQAKLAYVDTVAKPPRNVARKQAKYGTGTGGSSPTPGTSSSCSNISQIAAAQNQAKKKEIVSKAVVGGFTPSAQATEQVPAYNNPAAAAKILKKKKAPLMAKALQLIKSNTRYKR